MAYLKRCGLAGLHQPHDHVTNLGDAHCDGLSAYLLAVGTDDEGDTQDLQHELGVYSDGEG